MTSHAVIPLIATVAYLSLVVVLLPHRPWRLYDTLFLLFIMPAMLWSLSDFILRSNAVTIDHEVMVKVIVCFAIWMVTQFHFILRFFHTPRMHPRALVVYLPLLAAIVLAILGYIPQEVQISPDVTRVSYGVWIIPITAVLLAVIGRDLQLLLKRREITTDLSQRNQYTYLMAATLVGTVTILTTFFPFGTTYASGHIGNFIVALILIYAILAHQLLDIGVALRRVLVYVWLTMIVGVAFTLVFWVASIVLDFEFTATTVVAGVLATAVCIILVFFTNTVSRQVIDEIFMGERYVYRKRLSEFVSGTYSIADLEIFSNEFLPLLSKSLGIQRSWFLLPSQDEGGFVTQFSYSVSKTATAPSLRLREDSPLIVWLERNARPLSKRQLHILPEFASLWEEERKAVETARIDAFFPLMHDRRLVAILALGEKGSGGSLTLEETELIVSVLTRITASVDKEFLRERLQAKEEELTMFNRLMSIMSSSINIREAFDRFAQELKTMAPVDWATVALADEDELYFLALSSSTPTPWAAEERIPLLGTGTEWVMREQNSFYEPDLVKHKRFWTGEKHVKQGVRAIVYLPLISAGKSIGSLTVASRYPNAYSSRQIKLLEQLAIQITPPIANSQLYAQAREKARIDELTGLFNRRHFDERLKEEITRHTRYGAIFSLLMLDLDSFKVYNDIFGHPAGDDLLRQIAGLIKGSIRGSDQAFRYGGDEFSVLLPNIDAESAYHVAERVRQEIAARMQASSTGVTCSIGLASCPTDGVTPSDLVNTADTALYYAKYNGGNRSFLPSKALANAPAPAGPNAGETRSPSLAAIYALTTAVDAKDHYTYAHSQKVRTYSLLLAEALELPPDAISRLSAASLLHDIGKIGIRDYILTKKGPLTPEEYDEVKTHPQLAVTIIANVHGLAPCIPAILHHHERYDGSGYPAGLKGDNIPLEARVLAVADCFADMTSDRVYTPALSWEAAIEEIRKGAGTQFDPAIAKTFVEAIESGAIARPAVESRD